ncbi:hypothetical protein BHM03_00062937 [Ensete ventricosum]|nr:hypothetical protein BHM03_00062937 [Ensete ventricosum]
MDIARTGWCILVRLLIGTRITLAVDFDYRRSISGGINRGRKKKREKLELALLSRSLRMRDPSPAGDFFSPRKEKKCLLARGEGTR